MNCENTLKLWNVNGFEVRLLGNENYLGYETFDTRTNELIDKKSFEEDLKSMEMTRKEMIDCLEKCRVLITENRKVTFMEHYYTWNLSDKEINLIQGTNGLIWDIFNKTTKDNSYFYFRTSTVASARCHPETIAYIEKIKKECLDDISCINVLTEDFKVVRVLGEHTHTMELSKLSGKVSEIEQHSHLSDCAFLFTSATVGGCSALAASFKFVCTAVSSGIIGSVVGACAATAIVPIAFGLGMTLSFDTSWAYVMKRRNKREKELESSRGLINHRNVQTPLLIEIEPKITAPSVFDERVLVSKFTWAVILVSHGGQPKIPYIGSGDGNHAEIYIEGINDGFYNEKSPLINEARPVSIGEKFIHLAHYQPKIESGLRSLCDLKYETRSEIWMVTCEKVKMMLLNIENEKALPEGQRINYNMAGIDEFAGKFVGLENGHNCFTWARYHLKTIGIDLELKEFPPSVIGFTAALVTDYTKKPKKYTETPIQRI